MVEKKKPEIKEVMSLSEIDGFDTNRVISKDVLKNLKKTYGKISIPLLGIVLEDKKEILILIKKPSEKSDEKTIIVFHSKNFSEKDLQELFETLEKK